MDNRALKAAIGMVMPVLILIVWELLARGGGVAKYLSSPSAISAATGGLIQSGELGLAMLVSVGRAYAGFVIGASAGTLLGLAAGLSLPTRFMLDPLVAFLYPIPKIAFLPVFLLLFGLGHGSTISIIAFSVFFPVFVAARHAVVGVERNLVRMARSMGAGTWRVFFRVVLPATLPQIFAGMRIGLSLAFVLLFAAELIGSRDGLGFLVIEGQDALRFDIMLAGISGFAVAGVLSDWVLMLIRGRLLRGQMIGTEEGAG